MCLFLSLRHFLFRQRVSCQVPIFISKIPSAFKKILYRQVQVPRNRVRITSRQLLFQTAVQKSLFFLMGVKRTLKLDKDMRSCERQIMKQQRQRENQEESRERGKLRERERERGRKENNFLQTRNFNLNKANKIIICYFLNSLLLTLLLFINIYFFLLFLLGCN